MKISIYGYKIRETTRRSGSVRYQTKADARAKTVYQISILYDQRFELPDKLILVLEDQPLISLDIEEALADKGMLNLVTLRSQKEALAWLAETSPDFILLDLYLDDGDSQPVLAHIQENRIPFMIYTGSERPYEWDATLFDGSEWMSKPGDPDILADRVRSRLGGGLG